MSRPQLRPALVRAGSVLSYILVILINAVVFLRPVNVIPGLSGLRLYAVLTLACLALSFRSVLRQLAPRSLATRPISVCTLGLLVAVALSHLFSLGTPWAQASILKFTDLVVYYLLFVAVVNTPGRMRQFLLWWVGFCSLGLTVALLHYHQLADIPGVGLEFDGDRAFGNFVRRIGWAGIYKDSNDFALLLVPSILVCAYFLGSLSFRQFRYLWLAPIVFFGYGLFLTGSRGGFLALVGGVLAFLGSRFGWRRALIPAVCFLPIFFTVYSGRQTEILGAGTGQTRINLWARGFTLFWESPLFGIGEGEYVLRSRLVAHNSFVHCYTELGFLGGTLFLGAFYCAVAGLHQLRPGRGRITDRRLRRLRPYLLATVAAYGVGNLSLSRHLAEQTYMLLGLVTVYLQLATTSPPSPPLRVGWWLGLRMGLLSAGFLAAAYLVTVLFG